MVTGKRDFFEDGGGKEKQNTQHLKFCRNKGVSQN